MTSGDVLIGRSKEVPGRLIQDVPRMFSGRPLEDLESTQTCMSKIIFIFSWHAYRLIAEPNIFRFGGSLICLLYMLRKNRLAKKYNTERYIGTFRHIYNK